MNDNPSNVVYPSFITRLDIPSERIVDAIPSDMESIVVMGYDANGQEYFASSLADGGAVLWLMERLKIRLMQTDDE